MKKYLVILAGGLVKGEDGRWRTTLGENEPGRFGLLNDRLRVAASALLWKEDNELVIVASGGQGKLEDVLPENLTLAKVIKDELILLGVPAENIIEENKSGSTFEQMKELAEMIKSGKISGDISVISNNYHLPRIQAMMEFTELKNTLPGKVKLLGAEDVLLKFAPEEWKKFIEDSGKTEGMKNRLSAEAKGVEDIKSGRYRFGF